MLYTKFYTSSEVVWKWWRRSA